MGQGPAGWPAVARLVLPARRLPADHVLALQHQCAATAGAHLAGVTRAGAFLFRRQFRYVLEVARRRVDSVGVPRGTVPLGW